MKHRVQNTTVRNSNRCKLLHLNKVKLANNELATYNETFASPTSSIMFKH